jgi:ABC-type phosphate transport system permease subunit
MFESILPSVIAGYFGALILFFVLRKGISTSSDR